MNYRADIDGLRAIAVLSVMAFHYGAPLPGGFTGVDVFFVISGFLITQKLYADIERGTFSLASFYDRRVKRIVPALVVVLVASLIAGHVLLVPGDYKSLAASAGAAAFGFSNFYFNTHTNYFDQTAEMLPLLHTWSLAVEEQFYFVWPLALYALSFLKKKSIASAIGSIVVVSFFLSLFLIWRDQNIKSAFYMAAPRAWELAIGALLVFMRPVPDSLAAPADVCGIFLILAGFFVATASNFPGPSTLFPCLGAALIIWPKDKRTAAASLLSTLSPIGLISYSLYLWHWPVLVYFRIYINEETPTTWESFVLAAISLALAISTYRYIEQPVRTKKWHPLRPIIVGLASCALVFTASRLIIRYEGIESRISADQYPLRSREAMWDWNCEPSQKIQGPIAACTFGKDWDKAATKTLLWGDSHASHMAPIIEAGAENADAAFMLYSGCAAIFGRELTIANAYYPNYSDLCRTLRETGIRFLKENKSTNVVILAASWVHMPRQISDSEDTGLIKMKSAFEELIRATDIPGRRYIIIASVPQPGPKPVRCGLTLGFPRRACEPSVLSPPRTMTPTDPTDQLIRDIAAEFDNVTAVIPSDALCDKDKCDLFQDGEFLYRDASHIRRNLKPETRRTLAEKLGLSRLLGAD